MTLIELMMAMGIMALVVTALLGVLGQAFTSLGKESIRSNDEDQARLAVEELDREIRSGNLLYDPSIESGPAGSDVVSGMALRVYTQTNADTRDPGNRCVQWRINSTGQLQRRDWSVNWADRRAGERVADRGRERGQPVAQPAGHARSRWTLTPPRVAGP